MLYGKLYYLAFLLFCTSLLSAKKSAFGDKNVIITSVRKSEQRLKEAPLRSSVSIVLYDCRDSAMIKTASQILVNNIQLLPDSITHATQLQLFSGRYTIEPVALGYKSPGKIIIRVDKNNDYSIKVKMKKNFVTTN